MNLTINKKKTALIVVDMQNAFIDQRGSLAKMGVPVDRTALPIPHLQKVLAAARRAKLPIFHVRMVLRKDGRDLGVLGKVFPPLRELGHCALGSWDAEFYPGFEPLPGELVVEKNRFSAFFGTGLDTSLRCIEADTLIVTGLATNVCVEGTVRDAFYRDYRVIVPREATGSYTEEMERAAFVSFRFAFASVVPTEDVVGALAAV
jgi:ureidoacrylate peracid hydrolase